MKIPNTTSTKAKIALNEKRREQDKLDESLIYKKKTHATLNFIGKNNEINTMALISMSTVGE